MLPTTARAPLGPAAARTAAAGARTVAVASGVDTSLGSLAGVSSVFDHLRGKVYGHSYAVTLHVGRLVGGTPSDPNVAAGWIRTKMGLTSDELVQAEVEKVMKDRPGITADDAAAEIARNRNLSGFKRNFTTPIARMTQERASTPPGVRVLDTDGKTFVQRVFTREQAAVTFGELYIEGRQAKAMLKEAAMIAVGAGKENAGIEPKGWGTTRKGMLNFLVEHMFVKEEQILLGVTDPDEVAQSFVHTWRGSGIKLEEIVHGAVVDFTLQCDYDFEGKEPDFWAKVFLRGEQNGLGASRSQGFGTFRVTRFEPIG